METNHPPAVSAEDVKGEKDAGKEAKAAKEEIAKGNGKPPAERPRFMFNIADGGFTGESPVLRLFPRPPVPEELRDEQKVLSARF